MADGLSKDWTLQKALGLIRITANALNPDDYDQTTLTDILHERILQVAEMLGEAGLEEYITTGVLSITGSIASVSAFRIDRIVAMRSSTSGVEVLFKEPKVFEKERLRDQITTATKTVLWTRYGSEIHFYEPSGTTTGTITMIYRRFPLKQSTLTETIDIPDKYAPLALELAEAKLYELMSKQPPESLSASIASRTDQIRAAGQAEKMMIKKPA